MVFYFVNPSSPEIRQVMTAGVLGMIDTPLQGNKRPEGVAWCADNGCFNDATFVAEKWFCWLQKNIHDVQTCVFATAPDVVGDAEATLARSRPWLSKIRALGYPVAFVAQDGQEDVPLLWDEFDCQFIGGAADDVFKLGPIARGLVREAKARGKWVHMGRVNSYKRYRYAEAIGVDSVDGTYLVRGPDINLPRLLGWVHRLEMEPGMFGIGA